MTTNLEFLVITMVQKEYHLQAQRHRLRKLVGANQPGTAGRVLAWTGRQFVAFGERLQSHATPSTPVVAYSDGLF